MEQVAEALKQLRVNNNWNQEFIDAIKEECDCEDISIWQSEIEAFLNAIISIYGIKPQVIKWHDRTDSSEFDLDELYDWEHDITGEVFTNSSVVEGLHPEYANKWADGIYGGYCFDSNGVQFKTTDGIRGIGYKALIAFDRNGRGIVFF